MKVAGGIVKFIHQTGRADRYGQSRFFKHLADKVLWQAGVRFGPATGRAPQIAASFVGIDQQQSVIVQNNGAGGQSDRAGANGACHSGTLARATRSGNPDLIFYHQRVISGV
jgi:hypothetical protein